MPQLNFAVRLDFFDGEVRHDRCILGAERSERIFKKRCLPVILGRNGRLLSQHAVNGGFLLRHGSSAVDTFNAGVNGATCDAPN